MDLEEILDRTRKLIKDYAEGDPDKLFYGNRFVYARLQLDERGSKPAIKRTLFEAAPICYVCGKPVEFKGTEVHRIDGARGYTLENCALLHRECHQQLSSRESRLGRGRRRASKVTLTMSSSSALSKLSKRYDAGPFLYWWDITPNNVRSFEKYDSVQFTRDDSREYCSVPTAVIHQYLTPERQTSRAAGNWGVRVLRERPGALAFGESEQSRAFLAVTWHKPA